MSGVVISLDGLMPHREPVKSSEPAKSMEDHLRPALEKFTAALYRGLLGRDATSSEVSDWVAQILTGTSRNTVALCLLNSEERRRRAVRHYFQRFLDRTPSTEALTFWTEFLASGKSHFELIAALISSEEALESVGRSHEAYVRKLFQELYGRKPNALETSSWVSLLSSGMGTHQGIAQNFVHSREFHEVTIRRWHLEVLRHEPDREGLTYWADQMAQGTSWEKILAGLLSNNEYFSQALLSDGLPISPVS